MVPKTPLNQTGPEYSIIISFIAFISLHFDKYSVTQCENHGTGPSSKASQLLLSTAYTTLYAICRKQTIFFIFWVICRKQTSNSKEELLLIHKQHYMQKKRLQEALQSHFQIYPFFLSNGSNPNMCSPQWKPLLVSSLGYPPRSPHRHMAPPSWPSYNVSKTHLQQIKFGPQS